MSLLIATDHVYLWHPSGVHDTYCFDRSFFDDYVTVFGRARVLCRGTRVQRLPAGLRRSRPRTIQERLRRRFSDERPYRCDACGWRGILTPAGLPVAPTVPIVHPAEPDFSVLDAGSGHPDHSRAPFVPRKLA